MREKFIEFGSDISEKRELYKKTPEREMSRRAFMKKLAAGAAILGLGGIETILSTGCAVKRMGLKNEEIHTGLRHFYRELEDPNEYLKYLKDNEFVIKNEIFDSYARTVDKCPEWLNNPVGGYMSENYLDTKEEQKEFRERLAKLRLPQDEIKFYESFAKIFLLSRLLRRKK